MENIKSHKKNMKNFSLYLLLNFNDYKKLIVLYIVLYIVFIVS